MLNDVPSRAETMAIALSIEEVLVGWAQSLHSCIP